LASNTITPPYVTAKDQSNTFPQVAQMLTNTVLVTQVMHTRECPPVDLLIRTSGEQRLSDFVLWQSSHALLHWERCHWPEFGYWKLLRALLAWQAAAADLMQLHTAAEKGCPAAAAAAGAEAAAVT
jgi:undecaprenyl diphosphate synthase